VSSLSWEAWNPVFAPLVRGKYTPRVWDGERYEPQQVEATCEGCNEELTTVCDSGRVREKISKWAVMHLHR
jgi:hypothetical protein